MDEVTKHEIAAHERLEMIVKKEAKIQDKRDERERRRMRNLRKKANRAPALREKRFLKNAAKRAEEARKNRTMTERTKKWNAYKRFNPFYGREARIEMRKKMLKGDENWFEMNMILSKFGGDPYVSKLDKNKQRININGNRGPWKRPDISIAQNHASKWTMLNRNASWTRTNVSEFDIWGMSLQSYMILLRVLACTCLLLSILSLPLIFMNMSGNSLESYGDGMAYDVVRTTLGNIGNAKFPVERLNMTYCEMLRQLNQSSVISSSNNTSYDDKTRHDIEQDLIEACLEGPYVSVFGSRYDLQTAQTVYTCLDCVLVMLMFISLTYYLHTEKQRRRVQSMENQQQQDTSEYSVFVTGYPNEMRPPDDMMKRRIVKHMEQLYDFRKSFCAVNVSDDEHFSSYQPHGRSSAYRDRGMFYNKWLAGCTIVYRNDKYFKAFKRTQTLYEERRRYKADAWKFQVGTEYIHGPSSTAQKGARERADIRAVKIRDINSKIDPIIESLPIHSKQKTQLKFRKQTRMTGVFFTFEHKSQQRACLQEYSSYARSSCCGIRCRRVPDHLKFKDRDGKLHTLNVEKTPPPRQIIWEHINTNPIQRIWRKCISTFIFLFVIVFASYLTFWSMGSLDTDALQIDYTHCREEIAASYYSTYDFATSRAQTLTRPENPNEGNSRAILTSRDRMCLNNSRQHYDYDRSEPYEEQSYFVGFEAETNGQYWLPEYSPRIINRTFEVWTALGNIEKMYTFYDFSNVDYCFEPCWPGSTSKNRSTMCPSQSCFYDSIRPCSLFWKGTVPACYCRRYARDHLGAFLRGFSSYVFTSQQDLCSYFPFVLADVGLVNVSFALFTIMILVTIFTRRVVEKIEMNRTTNQRDERISSIVFWTRTTLCQIVFPLITMNFLKEYEFQPFLRGPAGGFDENWYIFVSPAIIVLLTLCMVEATISHIIIFINHRLRMVANRHEAPSQSDLNRVVEGPPIKLVRWTSRLSSNVCFALIYSGSMPLIYLVLGIGLVIQFAIEKYVILRFYSVRYVWSVPHKIVSRCAHMIRICCIIHLLVSSLMFCDDNVNYDSRYHHHNAILTDVVPNFVPNNLRTCITRSNSMPAICLAVLLAVYLVLDCVFLSCTQKSAVDLFLNKKRLKIRRITEDERLNGLLGSRPESSSSHDDESSPCYWFQERNKKNSKVSPDDENSSSSSSKIVKKLPRSFYLFLTQDLLEPKHWKAVRTALPVCDWLQPHELENPISRPMTKIIHVNDLVQFVTAQRRRYSTGKHGWILRGFADKSQQFLVLRKLWSETGELREVPHIRRHAVKTWEYYYLLGQSLSSYSPRTNPEYEFVMRASDALRKSRRCVDEAVEERLRANEVAVSRLQNETEASKSESECDDDSFFEECDFEWQKKAPLWKVLLFRHGLELSVDSQGRREYTWRKEDEKKKTKDERVERTDEDAKRELEIRQKGEQNLKRIYELQKKREMLRRKKKEEKEEEEVKEDVEDDKEKKKKLKKRKKLKIKIKKKRKPKEVITTLVEEKSSAETKEKKKLHVSNAKITSMRKRFPAKSVKEVIDAMRKANGVTVLAMAILRGEEVDLNSMKNDEAGAGSSGDLISSS